MDQYGKVKGRNGEYWSKYNTRNGEGIEVRKTDGGDPDKKAKLMIFVNPSKNHKCKHKHTQFFSLHTPISIFSIIIILIDVTFRPNTSVILDEQGREFGQIL
jgi:hypothetical protein